MTDQPVTNIVELAKQFRKALEQRDNKALSQIIKAYVDMYARLQDKISVLTLQMANMETPTAAAIRKLDSYKSLVTEIEKELTKFQGYAGTVMQQAANDAISIGVRDARLLTLAGNPAVAAGWKSLNPRVVENLVSYFNDGSPLMKRLDKLAGENALKVAQTIIDNVALGNNPKRIAGLIRESLGGGLTDALRMTRTVQIYSYREANRASYVANGDVVQGWYWMSALDPNTCMSCIAMHGTFHTNDETLNDHHNGLCTMIPATIGSQNPFGENAGQNYFDNLDESEQRRIMGDGKYEAYKEGKFEFSQLSTTTNNDVFGDMRTETSLKDLIESNSNNQEKDIDSFYDKLSDNVVKEFGIEKPGLEFVKGQGFPEYDRENNNVTLPKYLEGKSIEELRKVYSDLDQTIYHELGHAVQAKIVTGMSEIQYNQYKDSIMGLIEKLGYPTEYSKKNRNEWISERFALEQTKELDKILIPILKGFMK